MNTKNIFRTLFMAVLLLVGANNVKADEITLWSGEFDPNNAISIENNESWTSKVSAGCKIRVVVFNRHIYFDGSWNTATAITFEGTPLGYVEFTSDSYYDAKLSETSINAIKAWGTESWSQKLRMTVDNYMVVSKVDLVGADGQVKKELSNTSTTKSSIEFSPGDLSTLTYGDAIRIYANFSDAVANAGAIRPYYNDGGQNLKSEGWVSISKEDASRGYTEIEIEEADVEGLKTRPLMIQHSDQSDDTHNGIGISQVLLITGPQAPTYTLTYIIDDQTATKSVAEGADLLSILPTPTKTGHTFTGWSGLPDDGKMPANDLTVTAQFTINSYTLTYMLDNEIYGEVETYEYGATITPKAEPTRDGYTFSGWSGLPTTMPANNITVTGRFIKDAVYVPAEISDAGYATFCSTEPLDFSGITTLKAYYAIAVSDTAVTFKQVTGTVAAGTGLLLVGTTSQVLVAEAGNECTGNLLVGVLGNDEIVNAANKYVLVVKDGEVKFADTAAQAATVPAGKAYLQAPSNSRILTFSFDGEATGISAVNTVESQKQAVYNLQGQRVTTMNKGLYIINGKKVMIK